MAFRKLSSESRPPVHAPKKNTWQIRKRVNSVYIIKCKILSVSAETFLVVISVSVMLATFPKSKNKDETIAKHSQGHLFLVLKKHTFFCGVYCSMCFFHDLGQVVSNYVGLCHIRAKKNSKLQHKINA